MRSLRTRLARCGVPKNQTFILVPTVSTYRSGIFFCESRVYRVQRIFDTFEIWTIIIRFGIFCEFSLDFFDEWFELFPDEREIDECREEPSDTRDDDRRTDECSESTSYSSDKIGPEHLPGRSDILDEFLDTSCIDSIDESFDLVDLIR
jgi:hypothetical protein